MKKMWALLLEFFYLSSAIYFLHYLMAKSIVFQEISEQPPTPLLLPPFHVLTTTQTKPTKKHLRAQLNWQNTTNSDIQMQRSKYWGQPLLLLTAGEIEPTLSSEKFERQTNFPAIKSSTAGKRSLLFKILHQQRDPEPKYPIRYCTSWEIQNPNSL